MFAEGLEGKYEILDKLGEGGMGAVYKVRHRLLDEVRVIKVMRAAIADDEELKVRFLREARVATQLRHPNIAHIYDFTLDDAGNAYIVLEFIAGLTLQEILKRHGPLEVSLVLEVARQSLAAIGYLHRKHFVHRDISPDNLMLSRDVEGRALVKLIDLGIAKVLEGEAGLTAGLTATGMFLGKVRYTSPEQLDGTTEKLDGRSDLYSFGVVLYELLTGFSPIQGTNPSSVIAGHLFRPPRDFGETDPHGRLPQELREVILKALEKKRDARPQSAADFSRRLAKLGRDPEQAERDVKALLDKVLAQPEPAEQRRQGGSTQERLDQQFRPVSTPSRGGQPVSAARRTQVVTPTPAHEVQQRQVNALVSGARRLADLGDPQGALEQLEAARSIDPDNAEVIKLLEQHRRQAADEVEALIEDGKLEDAGRRLGDAVARFGSHEAFSELGQRLEELKRLADVERLIASAEANATRDDYHGALAALDEALKLIPGHHQVQELRRRYQAALERQEAERRRAAAVAAITAQLDGDDLETAGRLLDAAVAEHGESDDLARLAQRLEELDRRRRQAAARNLLDRARSQLGARTYQDALASLGQAAALVPGDPECEELTANVREAIHREEEERRRAEKRREEAKRIETRLAAGDLERAAADLEEALAELGEEEPLLALRSRVDAALEQRRVAAEKDAARKAREEEEARKAEVARKAREEEEARKAEAARKAREKEEARKAEAARKAKEEEAARKAEEEAAKKKAKAEDVTVLVDRHVPQEAEPTTVLPDRDRTVRLTSPANDQTVQLPSMDQTVRLPELPAPSPAPKPAAAVQATTAPPPLAARPGERKLGIGKIAIAAAAVLVLVVIGLVVLRKPSPPAMAAPGTLVLNAIPWGEVTGIVDSGGGSHPVPAEAFTPVALSLPPGHYVIEVRNRGFSEPISVEVELAAGQSARETARFTEVSIDEFFKSVGW